MHFILDVAGSLVGTVIGVIGVSVFVAWKDNRHYKRGRK